jgi:hypothetical protein
MKGALSKVLIVIGIIFIVAAILWWAIAVPALVKFPENVDSKPVYEGDVDVYQNPSTGELLAKPITAKLTIERAYKSVDDQYDSGKAVVQETITQTMPSLMTTIVESSQYVLDRKTIENVDDPRSWAYTEGNQVNRSGTFYINFPFDLNKDQTYKVFENKVNTYYEITKNTEKDEEDLDGLKVYNFVGEIKATDLASYYVAYSKYPTTMSFDELKQSLSSAGLDIDAFLTLLAPVLEPADAATLAQLATQPINLKYQYSNSGNVSIEPKTGSIIRLSNVVEAITVSPDISKLVDALKPLLAKYKDRSAELTAATEKILTALPSLLQAPPQKVYEARYSQTEESIKEAAQDAKDSIGKINWVKVYIPWILLILGAAVLVGGLLMGGSPAALEEEAEEATETPEE